MKKESHRQKLTFFSKEQFHCPLCRSIFRREELYKGGGRIVSGHLGDDLHRHYLPSTKFGKVYPLVYSLTVCPQCWFASFPADFSVLTTNEIPSIQQQETKRKEIISDLISDVNFLGLRYLKEGLASYLLAIYCYENFPIKAAPIFKQALCCLRASWLCEDMVDEYPTENYDYLQDHLQRKACFLYFRALELEQSRQQPITTDVFFGPDVDKNYSYDGFIYLATLLQYRYGNKEQMESRIRVLQTLRRTVGKIFGFGQFDRVKPSILIDYVRTLYDNISTELRAFSVSSNDTDS